MATEIIVGAIVVFMALTANLYLTWWSRRSIDRIAGDRERSAREIMKDMWGE